MADNQVTISQSIVPLVHTDLLLEGTVALNRFIFLRNLNSTFSNADDQQKCKIKDWSSTNSDICKYLKQMSESDPSLVVNIIKKALNSKSLYSPNEALWCLAYCLSELKNEDLRKEIRNNFTELISSSEQLLIFLYSYQLLKGNKLNFGRGMRTALEKWYGKRSSNELFDFLFSARKYEKINHKNVLHQIHLKLDDREKNKIVHSIYKKQDDKLDAGTLLDKMILKHRQIKHSEDTKEIIEILKAKEFSYKIQHIPTFAQKSHEVIDLIIPNMSLNDVIDNLLFFCSQKMLKIQDPISKKICNALQVSSKVINDAKLHPLHVFTILKDLEKRLTIHHHENANENGNAAATSLPVDKIKDKKFSNPFIVKKLQQIFNQTLNEQPKTGCRYFITVDFRRFSKRQSHVYGMRNILCSELQTIIGLSLLKNEKEVTIMSFSDVNNKLKPVEWTNDMNYEKAFEIYETEIKDHPRTKESITLPLKKALEDKKKVDVFITFVSSLGRTMGKSGNPNQIFAELQNYRKVMNLKMTKYVIINMTRKTPTIIYDDKNIANKGVLEVVGFSKKAAKTVEAYAKNCFA